MKRKAQLQMGETIAVMVIVILLLIFSLVIYSKIKHKSIEEKSNIFDELDTVELSQLAYNLPEIQCSFAEVTDYGCIDYYKAFYLAEMIDESQLSASGYEYFYYREVFGNSRISIQKILNDGSNKSFVFYESNRSWKSRKAIHMPIIIYDAINDSNSFGVMKIEKFSS